MPAHVRAAGRRRADRGTAGPAQLQPWPAYIEDRIALYDRLSAEWLAAVVGASAVRRGAIRAVRARALTARAPATAAKPKEPITITLPDGKTVDGVSWTTTPLEIAQRISKRLAEETIVAKVNGEVWDLERPFEGNASVEFLKWDSDEGTRSAPACRAGPGRLLNRPRRQPRPSTGTALRTCLAKRWSGAPAAVSATGRR